MKFRVVYEVDGTGWHASIPEVKGCRTWGRSLTEARRNIREALATCEDVYDDAEKVAREAELEDEIKLPAGARRALADSESAKVDLAQLEERARAARTKAARALADAGCSLRDIGELLGLSQESARQILDKGKRPKKAS